MNAFFIFCKRHRDIVREKYPHLENRCITKILGEWWASLEPVEKASYTSLAKQVVFKVNDLHLISGKVFPSFGSVCFLRLNVIVYFFSVIVLLTISYKL